MTAGIFLLGLGLYAYARYSQRISVEEEVHLEKTTTSEQLRLSKQYDIGFFDGESEQYAEGYSRLRQVSGA